METSILKLKKPGGKGQDDSENQSKISTGPRSFLSAIGSKLFSGMQQDSAKKPEEKHEEKKSEIDDRDDVGEKKGLKEDKKVKPKRPAVDEPWKRNDREFLKFKTKYNNSMGNIMRTWTSLIYCILILRLNLIKFVQENLKELEDSDMELQKHLREENLAIYKMIRKAQYFSQERSLSLWMHLEKLMHSRMLIKNALDLVRGRDANRDWKGAALKLAQIEAELENARTIHQTLMSNAFNEEVGRLENLSVVKAKEMENLISQISILKKKEVQTRARILLNMKNYKNLNNRRKQLLSVQKEMTQLKTDQTSAECDYADKIESIKNEIEESEKQIKQEKDEIKKLKKDLDLISDLSSHNPLET